MHMIYCLKNQTVIKITFTTEANLQKVLDTRFLLGDVILTIEVYRKPNKFPVQWKS